MIDPLTHNIADIQDNIIKEIMCHAMSKCEVPLEEQLLTYWDPEKIDATCRQYFQTG